MQRTTSSVVYEQLVNGTMEKNSEPTAALIVDQCGCRQAKPRSVSGANLLNLLKREVVGRNSSASHTT
jgi:hypothetical protein